MITATRIVAGLEIRVPDEVGKRILVWAFENYDNELAQAIAEAFRQPIPQIGEPVSLDMFSTAEGPQDK